MSHGKIDNKKFEKYELYLQEAHRQPNKGGNTSSLHSHALFFDGEKYTFLAHGSQQWAYKVDTVSFEYEIKNGYKNIIRSTFKVISKSGSPIVRGNHS